MKREKGGKIIFSDIDGTLFHFTHDASDETKEELLRIEKNGVPFVLVSARMTKNVRLIKANLGLKSAVVGYSGALILDEKDQVIYSQTIETKIAERVKKLVAEEFPDISCNTFSYDHWYVKDKENKWVQGEERITGMVSQIGDTDQVHKFLMLGEADEILKLEKRMKQEFPDIAAARSTPHYLEVMDQHAKKSTAVSVICKHYGFRPDEAFAFGDGHNDIDMLQAVKYGYAMKNAPEEVRNAAPFVTEFTNNEDGLIKTLNKYKFY